MKRRDILTTLTEKARPLSRTVAFPDSLDARTLRAAAVLRSGGALRPVLVGSETEILALARGEGIDIRGLEIEDPASSELLGRLAAEYTALSEGRPPPDRPPEEAVAESLRDPLVFAGMMVRCGFADGSVAGSVSTTSSVIRAALGTIGMRPGVGRVSSYFLMVFPERVLSFADCAVQPDPTAAELAEIAGLAADNFQMITAIPPVVAFLSFSTKGSAEHPAVGKARRAAAIFGETRPDIPADGELQVDAALDAAVAILKAPGSPRSEEHTAELQS